MQKKLPSGISRFFFCQEHSTDKNISRFLWDAHNCEESLRGDELGISTKYLDYWNDLNDIWFLGMQVINGLMTQVPTYLGSLNTSCKKL
jgi:hypothetical protein